ncbi:MAG: F0F1 ATP synthase subunit delta, partial [Planctomycetaceae bacterium]|nr:F0F1 ATP synthase subunit delta [Planctomycetaceae bacterium]
LKLQQEAESEAASYKQKTEELAHAKDELLADAGKDIQRWREEHLTRARAEVDDEKTEWYRALHRERESFLREARLRMAGHIHHMSQCVLKELANTDLQQQTIKVFLDRIKGIDQEQKKKFVTLLETTQHRILVESAFPLDQTDRENITTLVHEFLSTDVEIDFQEKPELICGIDFHVGGYKIAWNIQEPLEELEEEFVQSLNEVITLESGIEIPSAS